MKILFQVILVLAVASAVNSFLLPFLRSIYVQYKERRLRFREDADVGYNPILPKYDFIVVGSGPAGSVVANRLSEVPEWNVLVLEAGKDGSIYADIPAVVSYLQFTDYNWGYRMEKQDGVCLSLVDQRCPWPRGKGFGGTTLINYMLYTRGSPHDYDKFAADGNYGWSYADVLPYFLKSENIRVPELKNSSVHSRHGYLSVAHSPYHTGLVNKFIEAGKEMGYDKVDYNDHRSQIGVSRVQVTMDFGRRQSAAKAFLESVKERPNLHAVEKARVTKILIDKDTRRAIGVEFVKNRRKRVVYARKEVIVSAGSINTPQLLMLSGIGPKAHLRQLGIEVIRDLPVGKNLQEHVTMPGLIFLVNVSESLLEKKLQSLDVFLEWLRNGNGLLTIPGGVEGIAYVPSKHSGKGSYDIELLFVAGGLNSDGGNTVRKGMGISDDFYNRVFRSIDNRDVFSIWPIIMNPRSRGRILLKDKNPFHWPLMTLDYFQDRRDLRTLIEGIQIAINFTKTKAFQSIGSRLHSVPYPACKAYRFGSDKYWECAARQLTTTLHHQCCTSRMGPWTDSQAVVDPELRVYGIRGLRIADASIFPSLPRAHTMAPTIMVGEKAADLIKSTWMKSDANLASNEADSKENNT